MRFQELHLTADGGLSDPKLLGRAGEAELPSGTLEYDQAVGRREPIAQSLHQFKLSIPYNFIGLQGKQGDYK
jgi:hypothetical protein